MNTRQQWTKTHSSNASEWLFDGTILALIIPTICLLITFSLQSPMTRIKRLLVQSICKLQNIKIKADNSYNTLHKISIRV